jgi:hypothetical protein
MSWGVKHTLQYFEASTVHEDYYMYLTLPVLWLIVKHARLGLHNKISSLSDPSCLRLHSLQTTH